MHLGTRFARADLFLDFLRENESDSLIFVGDIIDGWAIKRKFKWAQSHSDVIQKVMRKARKGTKVHYITGNHDDFLRPFAPFLVGDNLEIKNEMEYHAINGKRYLVTHGDFFDSITMTKKWLAVLGDIGYDFVLYINHVLNILRNKLRIQRQWSLSKYVKDNVKSSISFITNFEEVLSMHAKRYTYDGVICGHIHKAQLRMIDDIEYLNCGDWVESCTALVEHFDGTFEIINWLHR